MLQHLFSDTGASSAAAKTTSESLDDLYALCEIYTYRSHLRPILLLYCLCSTPVQWTTSLFCPVELTASVLSTSRAFVGLIAAAVASILHSALNRCWRFY